MSVHRRGAGRLEHGRPRHARKFRSRFPAECARSATIMCFPHFEIEGELLTIELHSSTVTAERLVVRAIKRAQAQGANVGALQASIFRFNSSHKVIG